MRRADAHGCTGTFIASPHPPLSPQSGILGNTMRNVSIYHLSLVCRGAPAAGARRVIAPRHVQRYDYVNLFEAKAADLALLRLREDLGRFAPELATYIR